MRKVLTKIVFAVAVSALFSVNAEPVISVGDAIFNVEAGNSIELELSEVENSVSGVNFKLVLPEGMSVVAELNDELSSAGFTLNYTTNHSESTFTAVLYSTEAQIITDVALMTLLLEYDSGEIHSTQSLSFADSDDVTGVNTKHAVSNTDGSESLPHIVRAGRLFLISNTSDLDGDNIADINDEDIDGDGVSNDEELIANTDPFDATDNEGQNNSGGDERRYVFADYDGDGKADIWLRNRTSFISFIREADDSAINRVTFGRQSNDIPVIGDYDGDGITDVAFRRPSNHYWYILNSGGEDYITEHSDGITRRRFGTQTTDIPVPGDYNGDGKTDIAVRRPSNSYWYVLNSPGDSVNYNSSREDGIQRVQFGSQSQDIPVPCDYNGDGIDDFAVRRPSSQFWYVRNSDGESLNYNSERQDGIQRVRFGLQEADIPVPADYDGDGICDFAVRRPSTQFWYIKRSMDGNIVRANFGKQSTDIPIPADYDGDGLVDIAVRRANNFTQYILNSSDEEIQRVLFGKNTSYVPMQAPMHVIRDFMTDGDIASRLSFALENQFKPGQEEHFIEQVSLIVEVFGPGLEEDLNAGMSAEEP